jgi:phosphoglycerate kinase
MAVKTLRDLTLKGRRVFVRVDFNVPIRDGVISDDTRIRSSMPTIQHVLDAGASCVVLASHFGRPKGARNSTMSLAPVAAHLSRLLGQPVAFADDCIGETAERAVAQLPHGSVVLLENLRFHAAEEQNDQAFARSLARLADVYINDAFGAAHRSHASVDALPRLMDDAGAGLLMESELRYLGGVLEHPERPFVAVLGGAKVSDKIEVIENLIPRVDRLIIGGAMAYTFLKARGIAVGKSLVEDELLEAARDIERRASDRKLRFEVPVDHIVAPKLEAGSPAETMTVGDPSMGDRMGLDIGPRTIATYRDVIAGAKTVIWNGPMGVFEIDAFATGTLEIAKAVAAVKGTTVIGGGDSIAAVAKAGVTDRITHISTGGGASLEFLAGQDLPGVKALG